MGFQGGHGSGPRDYELSDYRGLVEWFRRYEGWATAEEIQRATGLSGRTSRSILSDADGVEFVVELGDRGYRLCTSWEAADRTTSRLESQAREMRLRAERRRTFADQHLERVQGMLWED